SAVGGEEDDDAGEGPSAAGHPAAPTPSTKRQSAEVVSGQCDAKEAADLRREGFPIAQDTDPSPATKPRQAQWENTRDQRRQQARHWELIRHKPRAFRRSPNTT
ncbi:unnamed protein product, partial [Arctogadus glacialis]